VRERVSKRERERGRRQKKRETDLRKRFCDK